MVLQSPLQTRPTPQLIKHSPIVGGQSPKIPSKMPLLTKAPTQLGMPSPIIGHQPQVYTTMQTPEPMPPLKLQVFQPSSGQSELTLQPQSLDDVIIPQGRGMSSPDIKEEDISIISSDIDSDDISEHQMGSKETVRRDNVLRCK